MADTRGANWALPDATRKSTPVTRPLRLICFADRVVIVSEDKRQKGKVIPMEGKTDEEIDTFVSAIWDHMKGWGIAGNGMHWRPILVLQPGPQGGDRAIELGQLLEGSGMEVRIKSQ